MTTTSSASRLREKKRYPPHVQRTLVHVALIGSIFVMLYPILWMGAASLRPAGKIFSSMGLGVDEPMFQNYVDGWGGVGSVGFGTFFLNSVILAVLVAVGNVLSCSLAAYAFARLRFRARKLWFALMIGTIMLPFHVLLIPQYILYSKIGWLDSFLPLVVPKFLATDAFFVFLLVQFFRLLPKELFEAARVDGCGYFGIFLKIVLPLSTPALATTAAFSVLWSWNEFLQPLIYLTSPKNYTVPIGLSLFIDTSGHSNYGGLFAMSVLSLLPVIGFFLAFQRLLVEGISTTGLK